MSVQIPKTQSAKGQLGSPAMADALTSDSWLAECSTRQLDGQTYHAITDVDRIPPFFMSLVSADDHWMFIASNGALTCGRKSADRALFPYYSADKLLDMVSVTGPTTLVQLTLDGRAVNWKPWTVSWPQFDVARNLYKSRFGNRICFEEVNRTLGLVCRYHWGLSRTFGFVRRFELENIGGTVRELRVLDGLRNVLPGGIDHQFQLRFSNLADAYKKSELHADGRLGVFYLSSIPSDRAEPSEGLRASLVWHDILDPCQVLLSDHQLERFLQGGRVRQEPDVCGQRGAFLTVRDIELGRQELASWNIVADVFQSHGDLARLQQQLDSPHCLSSMLAQELVEHDHGLMRLASRVDGIQISRESLRTDRHLSNSLFNTMRGGLPESGYQIDAKRLSEHVQTLNRQVWSRQQAWLSSLPSALSISDLLKEAESQQDADLQRICEEYLPLTFSRRHGDPTRPWNVFNIDIKHADGSRKLGYEGNWRDIFQNWEALALSYPLYLPSMIKRFVNASTIDGYNPYRITHTGFDWERLDPADSWANIGYWGDHQIVYLLKLLEQSQRSCPSALDKALSIESCVFADVPYRIRDFQAIRQDPRNTIFYDHRAEQEIAQRVAQVGTDGQLVVDRRGGLHRVSLLEKLVLAAAVKMTNWIPDAGIWLNTQRPEWNDAQNALVGMGASVITACHLRRYFQFLQLWLRRLSEASATDAVLGGQVRFSTEVASLIANLHQCLSQEPTDDVRVGDAERADQRRNFLVSRLQGVGEAYRRQVYAGVSGVRETVATQDLLAWIEKCLKNLETTVRRNRRSDALYHSYNLLSFQSDRIGIEHLDEMLEGQVAVIESGLLQPEEVVELLDALRASRLYRPDQRSYMLYPNRSLPRFDARNCVDPSAAQSIPLVQHLLEIGDHSIIYGDAQGGFRFAAEIRNASDLSRALEQLTGSVPHLVAADGGRLIELYEQTFCHRRFTGRANTFFAYEGLGSIYWHMVSKLALSVCRESARAIENGSQAASRLRAQFREIHDGIWIGKSPSEYGAFPTDPYSHTPLHAGAQQPGMTGQVKEDLLTRQLELGVRLEQGVLRLDLSLLEEDEFLSVPSRLEFVDVHGNLQSVVVPSGYIGFTLCQVPILIRKGPVAHTRVFLSDERLIDRPSCQLSPEETQWVLSRSGRVLKIEVEWVDA